MKCVRVNFRNIRSNLQFENTSIYLRQQGIIEHEPIAENIIQRGKLIKACIRHRSSGCDSLLKSLKDQEETFFKRVLEVWDKHKKFGRYKTYMYTQCSIIMQIYMNFHLLREMKVLTRSDCIYKIFISNNIVLQAA